MNIDKVKAGDIVLFERDGQDYHGRVSSIGWQYSISPFMQTKEESCLFVRCIENPEWDVLTLYANDIKDILVLPEKVSFT